MSKKQWGHGYHTGLKKGAEKNRSTNGYVGMWFFTTNQEGRIEYQGRIVRRLDKDRWAVQHHEWIMGGPNGALVNVDREQIEGFHLCEDAASLRESIHEYRMSHRQLYPEACQEDFRCSEMMIRDMKRIGL